MEESTRTLGPLGMLDVETCRENQENYLMRTQIIDWDADTFVRLCSLAPGRPDKCIFDFRVVAAVLGL